jgi:hypothetical protein
LEWRLPQPIFRPSALHPWTLHKRCDISDREILLAP